MQRSAPRHARLLACAAVPVMLIAGCSSGSDTSAAEKPAAPSSSAPPTLAPAAYTKLPDPCETIPEKTVKAMVSGTGDAGGKPAKSSDTAARGGCSWNGLDGYQYRWLNVTLQRFDSVNGIGSAADQAAAKFKEEVAEAGKAAGAASAPAPGIGDEAMMITAKAEKDKEEYQDVTVVSRTENIVLVLSHDGAGLEDEKTPKADALQKDARKAAGEAVAAVAAANG